VAVICTLAGLALAAGCAATGGKAPADCAQLVAGGFRPIADERSSRFLGKVQAATARCRGGDRGVALHGAPWVDWGNYWATGDASTLAPGLGLSQPHGGENKRGIHGALLDLEYQRVELIKFNLFDNSGTYEDYVKGRGGVAGPAAKVWDAMRLRQDHPLYATVGGDGPQLCRGDLIRFRNLTGICNDLRNPLMGATGMPFARNVQFEATYPDLSKNALARNRHGDRLGLLKPDPQVISRILFSRYQAQPEKCRAGLGLPGQSPAAECDYQKAPTFNVLAAFWIQFMTHDWFSHLTEGHNQSRLMPVGCSGQLVDSQEQRLTPNDVSRLGCRPQDQIDAALIRSEEDPPFFVHHGAEHLSRAYKTSTNTVTAWWDASQIYGFDEPSRLRVKRDPSDRAKLLLSSGPRSGNSPEQMGYLPLFEATDSINPAWSGQEAVAFPDNWSIGMSFYHNVFAREHNSFVTAFRRRASTTPDADSGLRNPSLPDAIIPYAAVSDDELFEVARLVIAAEIAKIHTLEWTTQLLYNDPMQRAMNANWHGLLQRPDAVASALSQIVTNNFGKSEEVKKATQWYAVLASGPGIFGLGNHVYADDTIFARLGPRKTDSWNLKNLDHVNGGANHFGSPFNFPEEFVTVYRLHPMLPDLIDWRELAEDPNIIRNRIPVIETFRAKATHAMRQRGLADWALSMGRQRLGLLTLQNHPQFLQNLPVPRLHTRTGVIDVAALDLIRDRERGVPRFNEFRRQYGLKQLVGFDDFIDPRLPYGSIVRDRQQQLSRLLRELYGQHRCDAAKIITNAQLNDDGTPINDCLGHPRGTMIDNIEDVDTVVGWLAEPVRPHGFAISETQLQVFILNASRRLFSDRFFTSSFRPEFYSHLGIAWVSDNGADGKRWEKANANGPVLEVSPLKRVLLRAVPELAAELDTVVNVFDPWARERGEYYTLQWKPRRGAESDPAFW
jgi:hypothetical protein